jgi:chemotaxis protein MotB
VVRYLTNHRLAKGRMSAVGFSDTRPLISPSDPRSVQMNRRVDVVVLTTLTAEQAALLPAAAGEEAELHTGSTAPVNAADETSTTTTTPHD